MPTWAADIAGYVLVASSALTIASGAAQAISYRFAVPSPTLGLAPGVFTQPRLTTADRVQLLTRGAGVFAAILLLLGAVCLVIAGRSDDARDGRRMAALVAATGLAVIVLVANIVLGAEVVTNAGGTFIVQDVANRVSSTIALLAPVTISAGVVLYLVVHVTSQRAAAAGDD